MKINEIQEAIDWLERLATDPYFFPEYTHVGICAGLDDVCHNSIASQLRTDLLGMVLDWPKFSGDRYYPVPLSGYEHPSGAYDQNRHTLWAGEYGAARRRLCGWFADRLREKYLQVGMSHE